jgi:hypothetical protein
VSRSQCRDRSVEIAVSRSQCRDRGVEIAVSRTRCRERAVESELSRTRCRGHRHEPACRCTPEQNSESGAFARQTRAEGRGRALTPPRAVVRDGLGPTPAKNASRCAPRVAAARRSRKSRPGGPPHGAGPSLRHPTSAASDTLGEPNHPGAACVGNSLWGMRRVSGRLQRALRLSVRLV